MEKSAEQWISEARNILVVCHIAPDGDAIGSLLGLGWVLHELGKDHTLACADALSPSYAYLPGSETIVRQSTEDHDLIIALDCSDLKRLGTVYPRESLTTIPIINIDHHVTNSNFGTVNWVDPSVSSTAEVLTELVERLNIPFTPPMATCLLNGIVSDTCGFRTLNTTSHTLEAAIKLMAAGASLAEIAERIFNRRPLSSIRLWAKVIDRISLDGRIILGEITSAIRQESQASKYDDGGLANFLITADEADVVIVLGEKENGLIDVSMRARPGFDVSGVAVRLGGGGHPQAAGCTIEGALGEVRERVLAEIKGSLQEHAYSLAKQDDRSSP